MGPVYHTDAGRCVDAVLRDVGSEIVLGIPIGIGKPNHFVNALFDRAAADRSIKLTIFTGLTFVKPKGGSELERRFTRPFVERLFGAYPDLTYAEALLAGNLPANIQVHEFFVQAGAFMRAPLAQQAYVSLNYTHVAKHLLDLGVNVLAQLVAKRETGSSDVFSFSSNTDITLDILPPIMARRKAGARIAIVGQVNGALPFMGGRAQVEASAFDHILDGPSLAFPLFAPPKEPVSLNDYAAAIHTAALIKDGGTIQLGIGAFSDALTHALRLRQKSNATFGALVKKLGSGRLHPRLPLELSTFETGLYGATELFVDGYLTLHSEGILKRRVFDDVEMQMKAYRGELTADEYALGAVMHAGFFFGDQTFYNALHHLTPEERDSFRMMPISFVNQLYGGEALKRAQRPHARFINSAMMATLLGAAISDQLEDGRVVSGVGGQYNFVAQAHELEGGRSIIELHATRMEKGRVRSNIRWSYGHTTIPRHLRDIVVTEYGAADLRGLSDRDTIAAMLCITDSRFQPELMDTAKRAGKLEKDYAIPAAFQNNTPSSIENALAQARIDGLLPRYPFGTDLTAEEQALLPALAKLKEAQSSPVSLLKLAMAGARWGQADDAIGPLLQRMGLDRASSMKTKLYAALLTGALRSRRSLT